VGFPDSNQWAAARSAWQVAVPQTFTAIEALPDVDRNEDGALQIMYGIDGRQDLTESVREDLSGYGRAHPVRIGNGAFDQGQNDVFGATLDAEPLAGGVLPHPLPHGLISMVRAGP